METSLLSWWQQRSTWRRTRAEGRHLVGEARRILRRKGYRIPSATADAVSAAIAEAEAAMAGAATPTAPFAGHGDHPIARQPAEPQDDGLPARLDRLRGALAALDEVMEQKLAFARKSTLREYSESIGIAIAIALLLRAFVVEAFQIPSGSMIPTLEVGDHIFVSKFSYGLSVPFTDQKILELSQPKRGDIIVFKYPQDTSTDYIKRVVGLPGETIEVRNNEVFINGRPMSRELVGVYRYSETTDGVNEHQSDLWSEHLDGVTHNVLQESERPPPLPYGPYVVPEGHVFVMGDNRDNSSDSRVWGSVRHNLIKGRALVVWWSRGSAGDASFFRDPMAWVRSIRFRRFFTAVK
jgi:signal peptidase I